MTTGRVDEYLAKQVLQESEYLRSVLILITIDLISDRGLDFRGDDEVIDCQKISIYNQGYLSIFYR